MEVESRKKALRYFFEKVVGPMGYKFAPDAELVDFLLTQEVELERKLGSPFCPCQARVGRRADDMKVVCPCIPFHREHYDYMKRCWCGLYVHKDQNSVEDLPQIPYSEFLRRTGKIVR